MKIQHHTKNKKIILPILAVLILLVISGVYLLGFKGSLFGWQPAANKSAYDAPTKEQVDAGTAVKDASNQNSNSGENPNDVGSDHPDKPVTNHGDSKATASLTITAVNQNDGLLQIRTLIGALTNEGTCTLTLTRSGKTIITRSADVQATTNSTTCKGFDIPVSELSSGEWQATVTFENPTLKATATQSVRVL